MLQNLFANVDPGLFLDFFLRLLLNLISIFILIRYIFYPKNCQTDYLFSLPQLGLVVFLIASILDQIHLNFAVALGLFAVFSVLRYRSVTVEVKEMTYLFTVIGISIINAMVIFKFSTLIGLFTSNLFILCTAYMGENYKPRKIRNKKLLTFSPTDLEILNDKSELLKEIKEHTKINVVRAEISKINAVRNEVVVWIYFYHK